MSNAQNMPSGVLDYLKSLADTVDGRVLIANLALGLEKGRIEAEKCRLCLTRCVTRWLAGDPPRKAFQKVIETDPMTFLMDADTDLPADAEFTMVQRVSLFLPGNRLAGWGGRGSLFIRKDFPPRWRSLEPQDPPRRDERLRRTQVLTDLLKRAIGGWLLPGAKLGGGERVVFFTRRESSEWANLLSICSKSLCADYARDYVGVPWKPGELLVEIKLSTPLLSLTHCGQRIAAPTAFEASQHDYFGQNSTGANIWNRTVDFSKLRRAQNLREPVTGAVEAVLDFLLLNNPDLQISGIGCIIEESGVLVEKHLDHLRRSRQLTDLIDVVCDRCFQTPPAGPTP